MQNIYIGCEFYKEMIDKNCYYVDKTMLINDIVVKGSKVNLFTRPRRFGKTMALTTLKAFFEAEIDYKGNPVDNRHCFEGKKIMGAGEEVLSMLGRYPVLFVTLKPAKMDDFEGSFYQLKSLIQDEVARHSYLLSSDALSEDEKARFNEMYKSNRKPYYTDDDGGKRMREDISLFSKAFGELSLLLKKHHGKDVIILIDEYDVPLENAYFKGYYDRMVGFIRSFFENSLKTNTALQFAAVTGCLRISKESIFTGMNNLDVCSVRTRNFAEYFGFTPEETMKMLSDYELTERAEEVKEWYDGYLFGDTEVYNPWSVTKYVKEHIPADERVDVLPEPYWSNTSSNSIVKDLVYGASMTVRTELDRLVQGGTIEKMIHEDITYADIENRSDGKKSEENLWNFLFYTGYLKKVSERQEGNKVFLTMCIPNAEVKYIYETRIYDWFNERVRSKTDRSALYKAILDRNCAGIEQFVNELLRQAISTFDSQEAFYHGFFLSLLYDMPDYETQSNREEGIGRPDIRMLPLSPKDPAILFEVKARKKFPEMEDGINEAFEQIRTRKYIEGIIDDGFIGAVAFGICFCRKSCMVRLLEQ